MAIKELSALTQPVGTGFLPSTNASGNESVSVSENNQQQPNRAQFLNRDALDASRSDLRANFQARRLNDALDGGKPTQVLVSPDQARYINKGLDGKDREVKFSINELITFSRMDDPREAVLRAALERFGNLPSDEAAINDYLIDYKSSNGGAAVIDWRGGDESGKAIGATELKIAIGNQIKSEQYKAAFDAAVKNNRKPPAEPKYTILKGDAKADYFSSMVIDAPMRQAVFSKWLDKNGSPEMKAKFERDKLESKINLNIEDVQKRLKKKFDALKNENSIHNSFVEADYQNALKDEIDKIINETKGDFRGQGLGADIGDTSETVLRGVINAHPLYRFLPDLVKDEMVKFGVGVEKGVIGIAAGVKGANDFVGDLIEDAAVYGLKNSGVDTSSYENKVSEQRAERREFWTQLSSISTKQLSQADRAYAEKIERGLRVTPYDLPNKSVTLGQVVPQIALGIATGGESIGAQILISAATQATLAGGETYITSNNRAESVKIAVIAGVQGAVAPVTAKLPLAADLAANALMTYTTGKLQGLDDNKIFESIVTQSALSGGFRSGNKLHDWLAAKEGKPTLSIGEAETAMRKHKDEFLQVFDGETKTSFGKNAREIQAKAQIVMREVRANYGRENKLFTKARYERAGVEVERYARRSMSQLNTGVDPSLLLPLSVRAGFHIEALTRAGRQTFAEFSSAMRADAAHANVRLSGENIESLYRAKTSELNVRADEVGIARSKLTTRTDEQLKADTDKTVKPGETVNQAETRAKAAQSERILRGRLAVFDALGETPQRMSIAENDNIYGGDNAHTGKVHGGSIIMERGSAPAGVRTIEGRIYGDPPWSKAENYSYKWLDDATMNRTVNDYVKQNWDAIRWDLANKGEYKVVFDTGKAIGEGYYNKGMYGSGTRQAVYGKTSIVKIVLKLDQIEMKPFVITAFPAGGGK